MNNFDIYSGGFYEMHKPWKPYYDLIAKWIMDNCDFQTSYEFGCGNGFLSENLHKAGKDVKCSDFSAASVNYIDECLKDKFTQVDVTVPIFKDEKYDMVMCFEVAEHIDPRGEAVFFENLTKYASKYIVFSSEPTTNGHGHINCHPREYWIEEICKKGFKYNHEKSMEFTNNLGPHIQPIGWYTNNFLYFERI